MKVIALLTFGYNIIELKWRIMETLAQKMMRRDGRVGGRDAQCVKGDPGIFEEPFEEWRG